MVYAVQKLQDTLRNLAHAISEYGYMLKVRIEGVAQKTAVAAANVKGKVLSTLKRGERNKDIGDVYTEPDVHREGHDVESESNGKVQEKKVKVDGLDINYLEAGSGEKCVLLIHGGVNNDAYSTWFKWNRTIEALSDKYRVVGVDLPGYGLSDMPRTCTQDYYVDFIGEFAKKLGIGKASIVGTSMGGGIALGYALKNSDSVDSLVLIGPYGLGFGLPRIARVALKVIPHGFISDVISFLDGHKEFTGKIMGILFGNGAKSIIKAIDGMNENKMREGFFKFISNEIFTFRGILLGRSAGMRTDYRERIYDLNNTDVRILFIQGDGDTIVKLGDVGRISRGLRNSRLDVVEGCKHSPHFKEPKRVNADIAGFLEEKGAG